MNLDYLTKAATKTTSSRISRHSFVGREISMAFRPFRPPSKHSKVVSHHSWNKWNNSAQAGNVKSHRRRVLPLRFRQPIRPQPPQQQSTQWEGYLGSYQFRSQEPLRAVSYGRVRKAR